MSRLDSGSRITVKPAANVYSVMAVIAALALFVALVFTIIQWDILVK
jgi:hypothetical protein